jgi:cyclic 2,3-diphosphoglycerate synthetase
MTRITTRTLLLVDGEHYPAVVERSLPALRDAGYEPVAAVFLGGFEKTAVPPRLGVPMHEGDPEAILPGLIDAMGVDTVLDLSDEPVLDPRRRLRLAALAVVGGAAYRGGGFEIAPLPRPHLTDLPTIAVIGTGKRVGKTAASIEITRHLRAGGHAVSIVSMGRGGPPGPVTIDAGGAADPVSLMARLAGEGLHATSDFVEDAVFSGAATVGTWRLGAGPTGTTVLDNFAEGVAAAERMDPDLIVFEGSGSAIPPARADLTVLMVPATADRELLFGYFGMVQLTLADVIVVVGPEPGSLPHELRVEAPHAAVLTAGYRPEPSVKVGGRDVVLVTTAPLTAEADLVGALRAEGARRVDVVHTLADRRRLEGDLNGVITDRTLVLMEVKAAAAAIVLPLAVARNADLGLVHNRLVVRDGALAGAIDAWLGGRLHQPDLALEG